MAPVWQNVLVLGIVTAAVAYVIRRVWRMKNSKQRLACPACGECLKWCQEAPHTSRELPDSDTEPRP